MSSSPAATAALPPPLGEQSNFVDPPSIQPAIISALTVCIVVSTLSVVLRCYAQLLLAKKLIWADFWMLFGWVFQAAFVGFLWACLPYGGGHHLWDVTKSNYAHINFLLFINYILYGCAILGPKISILLQLVAIFVPRGRNLGASGRWFYWASMFLIAVNFLYYVIHNFVLIFQCNPIAKGWNPSIHGVCLDHNVILESSGPFNIISDFLMFLLPLSVIWQLKLPVKTRLEVASAFTVGLFGCICSSVRVSYSNKLSSTGDTTWFNFQNQLWANAEVTTAILIANIIILPRFIRSKRETSSSYDYKNRTSRSTPKGFQRGSKLTPRHPSSDPYVELTESNTSIQPKEEMRLDKEYRRDKGTAQGIMRTIQFGTVEEKVRSPPRAIVNNGQADVVTEVTGNRTRFYDDDDDV